MNNDPEEFERLRDQLSAQIDVHPMREWSVSLLAAVVSVIAIEANPLAATRVGGHQRLQLIQGGA